MGIETMTIGHAELNRLILRQTAGIVDGIHFKGNAPKDYKPKDYDKWTIAEQLAYKAGFAHGTMEVKDRDYLVSDV